MADARPLGRLVLSRAGRDKGRPFIVLGYDGDRALVADGDLRPVERPKKKNLRHLAFTRGVAEEVAQKLAADRPVSNAEVRAAILKLLPALEAEAPAEVAAGERERAEA